MERSTDTGGYIPISRHEATLRERKYEAMESVVLLVLPRHPPGLTHSELLEAILPLLPEDLWPDAEKAGWWATTVRLDLEARGLVQRTLSRPRRWHLGQPW